MEFSEKRKGTTRRADWRLQGYLGPMDVKAEASNAPDLFARITTGLLRRINQAGKDPWACVIKAWNGSDLLGYYWIKQDVISSSEETILISGLPKDISLLRIQLMDAFTVRTANKVYLRPMSLKDQQFTIKHEQALCEYAILSQARLVHEGCTLRINVERDTIHLQATGYEPQSEDVVKLALDTELLIDTVHSDAPKGISATNSSCSALSVIADSSVPSGTALFNVADLIDNDWRAVEEKVLLVLEPLRPAKSMGRWDGRLALVSSPGSSKIVKKGTLHVNPKTINNRIMNTTVMRVINWSEELPRAELITASISSDCDIEQALEHFRSGDRYICPQTLETSQLRLYSSGTDGPFFSFEFEKSHIEYSYTAKKSVEPEKQDWSVQDQQLTSLLQIHGLSGVITVSGDEGSGKSAWSQHLADDLGFCLLDMEPFQENPLSLHSYLEWLRLDLIDVPHRTQLIFDNVRWILEPANMEGLPEEDRWALQHIADCFVEWISRQDRLILLILPLNQKCPEQLRSSIIKTIKLDSPPQDSPHQENQRQPLTHWDDIIGLDEAKSVLEETIIGPIKWKQLYVANGLSQSGGVLLYGPSGSGKTALMSALQSALPPSVHYIQVRGPELLSKYIGASEEAVRNIFEEARRHRPSVICFDEIDSLAPKRGQDNTGVTDRVVNQLLTEIDGTSEREGVFIVATTSRKDLVDPAVLRSGRIDQHVELYLPHEKMREKILQSVLQMDFEDKPRQRLIEVTEHMSVAHLKGLAYDFQLQMLKQGQTEEPWDLLSNLLDHAKISKPFTQSNEKKKFRATFA